jgi:hypothetical protein
MNLKLGQYPITKITGLLILLIISFNQFSKEYWNAENRVIESDVRGYYAYLPALFIHKDLKFERTEVYQKNGYSQVWLSTTDNGQRYVKFTSGMAILYSPFFLTAHALAKEKDGFSTPYKVALVFSSLFYLAIGILFLSKFLLQFFEDRVVSVTLLILYLGTNLYYYETGGMTYSHGYSFALLSLFLYASSKWLQKASIKWAIWIGISSGLMVLIRPIDIIFLLFLVVFGVQTFVDLRLRWALFWNKKNHIILMIAFFVLMITPQLLYFKHVFGSIIYYSYSDESFFFLHPHLFDSLLSYRNGWLVYSPVMVLSIIGLYFIHKHKKDQRIFVWSVSLLYFYVIASWWCWWYAGFGNRAYINLYPVLSLPIAALVAGVLKRKKALKLGLFSFISLAIILNIFQSNQFEKGIIHWGYMNQKAYWHAFGRTEQSQLQHLYLHPVDLNYAKQVKDIVSVPIIDTLYDKKQRFRSFHKLPETVKNIYTDQNGYKDNGCVHIKKDVEFALNTPISFAPKTSHIYISAWVKNAENAVLVLKQDGATPYYRQSNEINRTDGEWKQVHLLAKLPKVEGATYDSLEFYLWNQNNSEFLLDNLEVRAFDVNYKFVER